MREAIDIASVSLAADVARLNVISQNLVHANTVAYKRQVAVTPRIDSTFAASATDGTLRRQAPFQPEPGWLDHRAGALRFTGQPLDIAIEGDAFLEVDTGAGLAYTRRGDLTLDAQGRLVTAAGHPVMAHEGPLTPGSDAPRFERDGRVFDGDKPVGRIKLVRFESREALQPVGQGLFHAEQPPADAQQAQVRQGHLETSNVNTAAEMVRLIETLRHAEATQKVVQGADDMMERALRKLGEF